MINRGNFLKSLTASPVPVEAAGSCISETVITDIAAAALDY
ncbi:hypothetical protein SMSP2_00986 [Limihaloglobus sulfuriphilus]|uniref:Uncharacterized protein n=1 Tax=Limihaloglobus sulfuriphilus TaxID=1851148 RepID=A0A1Q2MD64_9BACT|nr:hypothetical protein [Limihaloglobus sulfuriphilus]AQQ70631.1 hypothetical protein SMSP2_00986 [Limihaloglobus sulfuriphilus]